MNLGVLMLSAMIGLIFLGVPVAFSIGVASLITIGIGNYEFIIMPQKVFAGLDSFPILAIPFFILAGNLMTEGGINDKIMRFVMAIAGWLKGSLAIVTVIASAIFAAISGSGTATVSAIGGITIPAMIKESYDNAFAAGVSSSAAILGPLIPPSIFLIVYGNSAQISINDLFMAAVIPGLMLALLFVAYCFFYAIKKDFPVSSTIDVKNIAKETKESIWALLMPVIILGGIFGGVFTPTEAAAVSAVYAFLIGFFVYKNLNSKNTAKVLVDSCLTSAILLFLLSTSKISSWVLAVAKVPQAISSGIIGVSENPVIIMLLINGFLFLVGMFMEGNVAIVILTPILLPLAQFAGLTPVQFGVVMCINLCIGLLTPPVGLCLILANNIAKAKFEKSFFAMIPFLTIAILVLLLSTYVAPITMWLPDVLRP
jgi:C4-dicarboxylate transporter DctM subunit